ncbi:hypothetical protein KY342_06365 [Candidatus Woesearchaeota archaeon]|nr:hypothetical protein [Candidatus Woesearchaeota archaeon]
MTMFVYKETYFTSPSQDKQEDYGFISSQDGLGALEKILNRHLNHGALSSYYEIVVSYITEGNFKTLHPASWYHSPAKEAVLKLESKNGDELYDGIYTVDDKGKRRLGIHFTGIGYSFEEKKYRLNNSWKLVNGKDNFLELENPSIFFVGKDGKWHFPKLNIESFNQGFDFSKYRE